MLYCISLMLLVWMRLIVHMLMMSVWTFMTLMMILMMIGTGTEDWSWEEPYTLPSASPPSPGGGGAYKFPGFGSRLGEGKGEGKQRCSNTPRDPWRGRRTMAMRKTAAYFHKKM